MSTLSGVLSTMKMNELISQFQRVDASGYPDIHSLSDADAVLWILLVGHEKAGHDSLTAAEIAEIATRVYRRGLTRQRVASVLSSAKELVSRSGRGTPARFLLLRPGVDRLRSQNASVILIDPTASFTAISTLEGILGGVSGEVLLCDPYVDDKTLLVLSAVPTSSTVKLLTLNISDPAQFRRKLSAYNQQYGNLEIRTSVKNDLHDRYFLDASRMWIVGQSLNGIGKKQTFIISVGTDVRLATERAFQQRWNGASKWQ